MVSEENPESSKVKELPGFFYSNIQLMNEINFYDVIQFVSGYTAEEKIITYAILGGIPHYLKQFDGFKSY